MVTVKYLSKSGRNYQVSPHFKLYEFASPGTDRVLYSTYIVDWLEKIRSHFGGSITVTSAYRTSIYNRSVGGASNSAHIYGQAVDFKVFDSRGALVNSKDVCLWLEEVGYPYSIGYIASATHLDNRYTNRIIEFPRPYVFLNKLGKTFAEYWHIPVRYSGLFPTAPIRIGYGTIENIKRWQTYLCWYGLTVSKDGKFGKDTEAKTKTFQSQNGLYADGKAGNKTLDIAKAIKR